MEDTWWEKPPPLLTEPRSTPYNGTHRGTVFLEVLSSFIWFWAVLVPKLCNSPHIIAMHPNQYNFPHIIHTIMFLSSGPHIHFHHHYPLAISQPITCRLVCNTNSYISMHYHHVIAYLHHFNLVSLYRYVNIKVFQLEIDLIIFHNSISSPFHKIIIYSKQIPSYPTSF